MHLVLFLLVFSPPISAFTSLTSADVTYIKKKLRSVVRGPFIPTAVRLAFHDCVGGCNGCLNLDNASNNGLGVLVASLDTLYTVNGYDSLLSRADFWALAGIYAVDKAIELNNAACTSDDCQVPESGLVFQWGRVDCDTAPTTTDVGNFPSANWDHSQVMDYFFDEFGFNDIETVALLGAHTLGNAETANSGYNGPWISGEIIFFNNEYYKKLADSSISWTHRDNDGNNHWQWRSAAAGAFMLNVDMALSKDITVDSDTGKSSCGFLNRGPQGDGGSCNDASTADIVKEFAESNDLWIENFTAVFTKMLAHGTDGQKMTLNDVE